MEPVAPVDAVVLDAPEEDEVAFGRPPPSLVGTVMPRTSEASASRPGRAPGATC